jgi:release factor glutamine methyltransferase
MTGRNVNEGRMGKGRIVSEPGNELTELEVLTTRLRLAGFVAAEEEAKELTESAHGDSKILAALVGRRLSGEPLAWITGCADFCGLKIRILPDVYVPRWQSEPLARRAVERLPLRGVAVDLCTGSGAIAKTLVSQRPDARVVASDLDERAVACARDNGVEVYLGDLFSPLPALLHGRTDVVVGVVPYVPTPQLASLQRDTLTFESTLSYDGGDDGADVLRRVIDECREFLRPGGSLLLELGGDQVDALRDDLARHGLELSDVLHDDDGDVRGIDATWEP